MDDVQYTAFSGQKRIATGDLPQVAVAVKEFFRKEPVDGVLIFEDETCNLVEIDFRGSARDVRDRIAKIPATQSPSPAPGEPENIDANSVDPTNSVRGPGRPKLGVVAREVTLLPRHWEWLNQQTGGASVALRKLVEEARRESSGKDRIRLAQEASYRFMSAALGNASEFEEVSRALFAKDGERFSKLIAKWPADLRDYLARSAAPVFLGA
ncbi:DUF2239 family protein [soil metagenome]